MKITHKVKEKDIYHTFEIKKKDIIQKDLNIKNIGSNEYDKWIIEFVECPICLEKIKIRRFEKKYERINRR